MSLNESERRYILAFWVKGNEQLQSKENKTGENNEIDETLEKVLEDLHYKNGRKDDWATFMINLQTINALKKYIYWNQI